MLAKQVGCILGRVVQCEIRKIEVFYIDWRAEREVVNQQERNGGSAARADAVSQERHRSASESVLGAGCDVVQRPSGLAQFPARMAH